MRIAGKSAFITGAARGIGRALAEACVLLNDEADHIVSQCYNVDGGQWMS